MARTHFINHIRAYHANSTMGELYIEGRLVAHMLEDTGRPVGVKVPKETCIPEATYIATVEHSPKYGKELVTLTSRHLTHSPGSIEEGGIAFTGIRVHGGNTVEDTEGCPMAGAETNGTTKVWDCAGVNSEILAHVKANQPCFWVISSL